MDHPLIGIGAKNFYKHNALGLDVHNVYLQLLAENGVIGFCLMIFAFAYRLRIAYYCSKANFDADLVLCLGVQIFFLLYSLTGNALYDVNFFYVYLIFSSYTLGIKNAKQNEWKFIICITNRGESFFLVCFMCYYYNIGRNKNIWSYEKQRCRYNYFP